MTRSTTSLLWLLAVATAVAACVVVGAEKGDAAAGRRQAGGEIAGGFDVPNGQYPFVAGIGFADGSGTFLPSNLVCGGSLIAPSYVLTAAHCVGGVDAGQLVVVVGRTDLNSGRGEVRHVAEVRRHPSHNARHGTDDLAVLRLDQPIKSIAPIALVGANDTSLDGRGTSLTAVGWGDTVPFPHPGRPEEFPERLQQVQVTVVSDPTCAKQWRQTGYKKSSSWSVLLCTTPGRFGTGDSGGPLFTDVNGSFVQVSLVGGGYEDKVKSNHDKKHHPKRNKPKKNDKRVEHIPDYGPQLSAPSSADFIAAAIGG